MKVRGYSTVGCFNSTSILQKTQKLSILTWKRKSCRPYVMLSNVLERELMLSINTLFVFYINITVHFGSKW